jgi:hypothetical protein
MYVRNSQNLTENVRKSNPIFICHDNVKHDVDECHKIYGNIESQSNVQYFMKTSGTHCDVKDMVEGVYYQPGSAAPFCLDDSGSL